MGLRLMRLMVLHNELPLLGGAYISIAEFNLHQRFPARVPYHLPPAAQVWFKVSIGCFACLGMYIGFSKSTQLIRIDACSARITCVGTSSLWWMALWT